MTRRGRLIAVAGVVVLVFAGGIVELVRSRTPECSVAAPRPSLPPALRAIGDFDQAYDAGNLPALEDAAARAAGTLHSDLIGTSAEPPVEVAAQQPAAPAAEVFPLRSHTAVPAGQLPGLAGLVLFLLDCQGNAYFATVEDDATAQPPLTQFPPVSREQAAAQLGSAALRLDYVTSPLHPQWVTVSTPIQSVPAR